MLSSVLSSARAVTVNIEIMRTFVRVRELATTPVERLPKAMQQFVSQMLETVLAQATP